MEIASWKCFALIVIGLCSMALAAPAPQETIDEPLSPVAAEENSLGVELDREKRKLPEATFGAKNAILGYVFGKLDSILDAKTRLITSFDQTNIAKNKEYGIVSPQPIDSLQALIQAVISPKIAFITKKFGALSGGSSGGGFSLSGSADTGATTGDDDTDTDNAELANADSTGGASAGSGNIVSSFLKLSGPILSSSASSAKGGQTVSLDDSEE